MGRLFGTDGARGIANSELTCELAMEIGRAAAMVLTKHTNKKPRVLIGMDTRASSEMLESAITAGLCSVGADVMLLGEIPTPAVAYLVKHYKADVGVVISASHNPFEYNGIKFFNGDGFKLDDDIEDQIEELGALDAVLIPVGGTYTLDCQQASDLADKLQVKTVIPMHYRRGEVGFDVLQTLQEFLILRPGHQEMPGNELEITDDMPETTIVLNL